MDREFFTSIIQFACFSSLMIVSFGVFAGVMFRLIKDQLGKTQSLTVYAGNNVLQGIPFYIKKGRLLHETSYIETLATCSLIAKKFMLDNQKKPISEDIEVVGVKTVSLSPEIANSLVKIQANLKEVQIAQSIIEQTPYWDAAKQEFEKLTSYTSQLPNYPVPMEQNIIVDSQFVDYDTVYYLNKLQPISGSSEVNIELAADGTLTKTSASTTDSTLENILGFVSPDKLKEKLETKPEADQTDANQTNLVDLRFRRTSEMVGERILEVVFTVEHTLIRHVRYREEHYTDRGFKPPIPLNPSEELETQWYRREIIKDFSPKKTEPTKEPSEEEDTSEK